MTSVPSAADMRRVAHAGARSHNPAFDAVVAKAAKAVHRAAAYQQTSVAFPVPSYVQGFPIYKAHDCAEYVGGAFASKGYDVVVSDGTVVLTWDDGPARAGPDAPPDPGDAFSALTI